MMGDPIPSPNPYELITIKKYRRKPLKVEIEVHCLRCHWEGPVEKLKPVTAFQGIPPERILACPQCEGLDFEANEVLRGKA